MVYENDLEITRLLLNAGADPTIQVKRPSGGNWREYGSPLLNAINIGRDSGVRAFDPLIMKPIS